MSLDVFYDMVCDLRDHNSTNDKIEILKKWFNDHKYLEDYLRTIYDDCIVFNITSKIIKKKKDLRTATDLDLWELLNVAATRKVTGHDLIGMFNTYLENKPEHIKELIYYIIDKDLRCSCGTTLVNKALSVPIPVFKVALANKYDNKYINDWTDWRSSHKLDGCRCLVIKKGNSVSYMSRTGKPFLTLDNLTDDVMSLSDVESDSFVLDCEVCVLDENGDEDFQGIMQEIKRKNHSIENPVLKVFDVLTVYEFESKTSTCDLDTRLKRFDGFNKCDNIQKLDQITILDDDHFNELYDMSVNKGWEGLILRKNTTYKGKRSNDILKVKKMSDDEFTFIDVEFGVKKIMDDKGVKVDRQVLAAGIIDYKGYRCGVGSGWSDDQRIYYYDNPNELIGKVATIQYFEETKNKDGTLSLRFPVVKHIFDDERDV
jgi:DNA ligase-1